MNPYVKKLRGANLDIDFSNANFGSSKCPWNEAEGTDAHKCAVKDTSICDYFCGVQFVDSVLCSYPRVQTDVLERPEMDRDKSEIDSLTEEP